jgi:hypothetical protein
MIKTRIEMYDSGKNTIKPVFYAASAWVSWVIIFGHIFQLYGHGRKNQQAYTDTTFQVVEFFFFFTLVLCAQRLLSHLIAFAFHRTAFKERLDAVEETLIVIEKLREYRPKPTKRASGFRTPLFGTFMTPQTPQLDKDNINLVSSKLKDHKRRSERGEVDWERENMGKDGKAQRPGSRPLNIISEDNSPHRYPPSRGERETPDATLVGTAAKVFKSALLHDARNIVGNDTSAGTQWNVNSASEAKVRHLRPLTFLPDGISFIASRSFNLHAL